VSGPREKLAGAEAIRAALARGEPLRLIVVDADAEDAARALAEPAQAAGVPVQRVGSRHFERLRPPGAPGGAVALLGPPRPVGPAEVLAREGAAWLLAGVVYPGNAGMAIRTAEVSGAAGVFVDADFDHAQRREALRASMRADRFVPVLWCDGAEVLDAARAAGRRAIALEDSGDRAPWEVDLTGPVLFAVGAEHAGIPEAVLARCDAVVRIPTAGFIRSYNLQAAVAIAAAERLRQLGSRR
jgi:tRNA G18 (ribose-2'-O)-methylase SpoU